VTKGPKTARVVAYALAGAGLVFTLVRMFYGADFVDEAFYAATAYRFAIGQAPLVDDSDAHQTAALLLVPYVKAHLAIFGDTTGILLGLRLMWFLASAGVATLWLTTLRRAGWALQAVVPCAVAAGFIPYMIPALSYNTVAILGLSAGLALTVRAATVVHRQQITLGVAGLCFGLACFAYPTMVVMALAAVFGVWWVTRSRSGALSFAAGGMVVALLGAALLLPFASGIPGVLDGIKALAPYFGWAGERAESPVIKLAVGLLGQTRVQLLRPSFWLALSVAGLQLTRRRVPALLSLGLLVSLPIPSLFGDPPPELMPMAFVQSVVVAGAIVALSGIRAGTASPPQRAVAFTFAAAGAATLTFMLTSGLGWITTAGFGTSVALAPALTVLAARLKVTDMPALPVRQVGPTTVVAATALSLGLLVLLNGSATYRDGPPLSLDTRVGVGPHAGLVTTRVNAEESEALSHAITRIAAPDDRVFAYHGLPAAYLFTEALPAVSTLWTASYDARGPSAATDIIIRQLETDPPDIVVKNLGWPTRAVLDANAISGYDPERDAVERFVADRYEVVESGLKWQLMVPK
jgi:hypothetical protein